MCINICAMPGSRGRDSPTHPIKVELCYKRPTIIDVMATASSSAKPKATGILYKRQRGKNSSNLKGLKFQRRRIHLMPKEVEYYGMSSSTIPNGKFFVDRIKIVEKVPEATFRKKYCFQVRKYA